MRLIAKENEMGQGFEAERRSIFCPRSMATEQMGATAFLAITPY
jgi:hypothetical protein